MARAASCEECTCAQHEVAVPHCVQCDHGGAGNANRGLHTPLTANRMLGITVSISLVAQMAMVYFPPLQGVFQTTGALVWRDLAFLVAIAAVSFGMHEARRTYERRIAQEETKDFAAGSWIGPSPE
ncbi:hypothetical protein L1887_42350 [Cichorium endivia]|nr:hypothetical protein L1887_42350 [Cichorium endivia]